jgi:FeS assembly SUF system protein
MPTTAFAASPKDTKNLMDLVGSAPMIVKLLESTQGKGVVLAETKKAAESVIDAFRGLRANFLVQQFVKEAAGEDIRCLVVGGKVVAAMKRTGAEGDFRSNLHRGGSAQVVRITPAERSAAVRSAKAFGLGVAGVDLLRSEGGPEGAGGQFLPRLRGDRDRDPQEHRGPNLRHDRGTGGPEAGAPADRQRGDIGLSGAGRTRAGRNWGWTGRPSGRRARYFLYLQSGNVCEAIMNDQTAPMEGAPLIAPSSTDHPLYDQVAEACRSVYDPEIPVNIFELGLIYTIDINDENEVKILMSLTAPGCPVAGEMPGWVADAVEPIAGVKQVDVELTWEPPWGMDMMSDEARLELGFM